MIDVQNVTFRYHPESEPVIRNLNLRIKSGESVCIMGANGSGKSTLARILAGLMPVSEGEVIISDSEKTPLPVGIIFQNPDNQIIAVSMKPSRGFR